MDKREQELRLEWVEATKREIKIKEKLKSSGFHPLAWEQDDIEAERKVSEAWSRYQEYKRLRNTW